MEAQDLHIVAQGMASSGSCPEHILIPLILPPYRVLGMRGSGAALGQDQNARFRVWTYGRCMDYPHGVISRAALNTCWPSSSSLYYIYTIYMYMDVDMCR